MNSIGQEMTMQAVSDDVWFGGGLVRFKITSKQSAGAFVLIEHTANYGKTTPLHLHTNEDETFYLLEGEILLYVDGVEKRVGPGEAMMIPRGTPHAFLVTSESARSVWFITPGEVMETFYRQAGDVATDITLPIPPIDIPRIISVGESTGAMKFLGPPPFAKDGNGQAS